MRYSATIRLQFIQRYFGVSEQDLIKLMDNYYSTPGWEFDRTDQGKIKQTRWTGDTKPAFPRPLKPKSQATPAKSHAPYHTPGYTTEKNPQPRTVTVSYRRKKTLERV